MARLSRDISPLRYPGSKKKLLPYLEAILVENRLAPRAIIEPFTGGGSVFLHFLTNGLVERAIISDKDILISSFWQTLFAEPSVLATFVREVDITIKSYYKYKAIARNPANHSRRQLAKACLFLNRTSFSGILAPSSGPIGGVHQESKYKIDCRFNRETLVDKIDYISAFGGQVTVLNYDWHATVSRARKWLSATYSYDETFYYLDPPFYNKARNLYRTYFTAEQHSQLRDFLRTFDLPWVLSYDDVSPVRKIYSATAWSPFHVDMPYSINSHAKRIEKELVISALRLPILPAKP